MEKDLINARFEAHSETILPESLGENAGYRQLVKKKLDAETALQATVNPEVWEQYLKLDEICNELEGMRYKAMYLAGASDYEKLFCKT